ncbi:MAG: BTAD domain-containing putative transcriptional regulator [Candidatus Promineifilaceae bacterium]
MAQDVGDLWIEANIRLVMGATFVLHNHYDSATAWLSEASNSFRECGDTFGKANTLLWHCLLWNASDDTARLERDVSRFLQMVRDHNYEFVFSRKTLLGPLEPRSLIPLLLFARANAHEPAYVNQLLLRLNLPNLEIHPGYQLRVHMLGNFTVWHGGHLVGRKEWSRKKAQQLFQLLLTNREKMLERERIIDMLWPDLDPSDAQRDFKVAYSDLRRTLEPGRLRNAPSAYIIRDGSLYGMRPGADLYLDVERFEDLISQGDDLFDATVEEALPHYREALALYEGDYLQECLYDDWCVEERERLQTQYLRVADRVAVTLAAQSCGLRKMPPSWFLCSFCWHCHSLWPSSTANQSAICWPTRMDGPNLCKAF